MGWVDTWVGLGWVQTFPLVVGQVGLGYTNWTHGQLWDNESRHHFGWQTFKQIKYSDINIISIHSVLSHCVQYNITYQ